MYKYWTDVRYHKWIEQKIDELQDLDGDELRRLYAQCQAYWMDRVGTLEEVLSKEFPAAGDNVVKLASYYKGPR